MGALLILGLITYPLQDAPKAFVGRERGKLAKIGPFPYSWGIVGPFGAIEREKAPKGEPRAACAGQGRPCVQPLCSARGQWPPMGRPSRKGRRAARAKPDTVSDLRTGCKGRDAGGQDLEG